MSIQKDASGTRSIQVEVEVPGTPEEVWRAIATGPGISSWFVPTRSDEREGGQVVCNFGPGMDAAASISAWQPPLKFTTQGDLGMPGSPKMATAWTVEARAGGTCIVRVVHSLFASTDDWDNQLKGLEEGWPAYFRVLRMYLSNFKSLPGGCALVQLVGFSTEPEAKAWEVAGGALGLLNVSAGSPWSTPSGSSGPPRLAGVIDSLGRGSHKHTVLIRLDSPAPGTAYIGAFSCGGMIMVCVSLYLYGPSAQAAADRERPLWEAWMAKHFPAPQNA